MKRDTEIYNIFYNLMLEEDIKDADNSTLTRNFHKLEKLTSYNMDKEDAIIAYRVINGIGQTINERLKSSSTRTGMVYKEIFYQERKFVKWFFSLSIPHRKYVDSYLQYVDWDFVRGFMDMEEANEIFSSISWARATLIASYFLKETELPEYIG